MTELRAASSEYKTLNFFLLEESQYTLIDLVNKKVGFHSLSSEKHEL